MKINKAHLPREYLIRHYHSPSTKEDAEVVREIGNNSRVQDTLVAIKPTSTIYSGLERFYKRYPQWQRD